MGNTNEANEGSQEEGIPSEMLARYVGPAGYLTELSVPYEFIKVGRKIGSGGSAATVYEAELDDETVAFKCYSIPEVGKEETMKDLAKEATLLKQCCVDDGVLDFIAIVYDDKKERFGFLMEACKNGDLLEFMLSHPETEKKKRLDWLRQIAISMEFLHKNGVIHRDLKLDERSSGR